MRHAGREVAARLRGLAWARGLILLIADDPALARAIGANGLHLPEVRAREAAHWRAKNPGWLITASAHSSAAVLRAAHADAVLLSPVFATGSHKNARTLSAVRARLIARGLPMPLFALGGVTAGTPRCSRALPALPLSARLTRSLKTQMQEYRVQPDARRAIIESPAGALIDQALPAARELDAVAQAVTKRSLIAGQA